MSKLEVGFSRVDVTPLTGIGVAGYYKRRISDGVLDALEATAIALRVGETTALLVSVDTLYFPTAVAHRFRGEIAAATGLPVEAILLHATHIHTGPYLIDSGWHAEMPEGHGELVRAYLDFLGHRLADACCEAIEDLSPASMGYAVGRVENVAFIRRFRMKDGSVRTNPGIGNPEILEPLTTVEDRLSLVRFDREGKSSVALFHFGLHPDVIGGTKFTADWPGVARRTLEAALPDVSFVFVNGAQGDVNHVNVKTDSIDYEGGVRMDFGQRNGYGHARYIGRAVAGGVLRIFDKVIACEANTLAVHGTTVAYAANKASDDVLPEAHRINDLHLAGRDDLLPYKNAELTTVVAEAARMVALESAPDFFEMPLIGLSVGPVALLGIPGEPFTGAGRGIRATEGKTHELILPLCCTNGYEGYFPTKDAYDEGGYEARASRYKAGTAEKMIADAIAILKGL